MSGSWGWLIRGVSVLVKIKFGVVRDARKGRKNFAAHLKLILREGALLTASNMITWLDSSMDLLFLGMFSSLLWGQVSSSRNDVSKRQEFSPVSADPTLHERSRSKHCQVEDTRLNLVSLV
jgi:hypothetical protein